MTSDHVRHLADQLDALERPSQRQIQAIMKQIYDHAILGDAWSLLFRSIRRAQTPDITLARLFALDAFLSVPGFVAPCNSDIMHAELEAAMFHFAILCATAPTEGLATQFAKLDEKWVRRRLLKHSVAATNSIVGERRWIQAHLQDLAIDKQS